MVEAKLETPPHLSSSATPTAMGAGRTGYFDSEQQTRDTSCFSSDLDRNSSPLHDTSALATPLSSVTQSDDISSSGDASFGMSELPKPDSSKAGPSTYRRRPRPPQQRSNSQVTSRQSTPHSYTIPSPNPTENVHNPGFQGSPIHYATPGVNYGQRSGFVGQYTMPAQPNSLRIVHSPPYAFSHPYHHHMASDNNSMMSHSQQNIHAMLQPHAPVFHYQSHSTEPSPSPHLQSLSGSRNSPMYSSNPSSSPTSSQHIPSATSQSGALSPSYHSPTQFHSLQYAPAIPSPPYPYPPQSYSTSPPIYQPQYAPSHFPQHYGSASEPEPQGAWYYLPHNPNHTPQQQYDANPQYQGHYTVPYPHAGQAGVESGYAVSTHSASQQHPLSLPSENRTPSSESISASGFGSPYRRGGTSVISGPKSISSDSGGRQQHMSERPVVRRSYHPNPPAHRSEWVMWAGNVPSDATHDELWRFFNTPPESDLEPTTTTTGVLSIFLISRSSCAFINYETEEFLQQAISRFNGVPLRPNDPRCARLVCRVRRKDDDLKAGVGGQRGMGMHMRWVREQKGKEKEMIQASEPSDVSASEISLSPTSVSEVARAVSNLSMSSDEENKRRAPVKHHSSSSGSYASTNSSFLAKHFPHRYFILKSLTQEDLDISVERGVWATQRHNEEILDQAFKSSKEVHLIFSVNKSGEFYGYARMSGPVRRGEDPVAWASRPPIAPRQPATSPDPKAASNSNPAMFLSPSDHRFVEQSPLPINITTAGSAVPASVERVLDGNTKMRHSAPALLGEAYKLPTVATQASLMSLEPNRTTRVRPKVGVDGTAFELDPEGPVRALRAHGSSGSGSGSGSSVEGGSGGGVQERVAGAGRTSAAVSSLGAVQEEVQEERDVHEASGIDTSNSGPSPQLQGQGEGGEQPSAVTEVSWGDSFAVEWLCTDRVPFHRVKHLRNPWNRDREIKISRDGTELEPTVGQRLLDEWHKLADPQLPPSLGAGKPATTRRDRERPTRP